MNFLVSAMAGLAIGAILVGLWLWLALRPVWRLSRGARPPWYAWAPLQISLVVLVLGLIVYTPKYALLLAGLPPIVFFDALFRGHVSGFLGQIAVIAVPATLAAVWLCVACRPLRVIAVGVGLATLGGVTLVAGERISQTAMCTEARALGATEITRIPLASSIGNRTGGMFRRRSHAQTEAGGHRYGWSYSQMGWYRLPEDVVATVDGQVVTCDPPT
ncbi:hypothetical protein [uncultured Roseobacter sp.]|uniref:hypothetical protein n=1 Tax=uncultured Roseobacter sp. TaxID=114847 RepID=UPI00261DD6A1|nr:hypothetical protein [uncultured Roseobacter sp.]